MRLLEICVDSLPGLEAAVTGGADRIELCSALALGGLSPSVGMMRAAAGCGVPVLAMIRPRSGGFQWSGPELAAMETEIAAVADAGLAGVVIGALEGPRLDMPAMRRLMRAAHGLDVTLHRCVDLVDDPLTAVDQAAELGLSRILTSGGALRALDGVERLRAMQDHAGQRCAIMPGSGITPATLPGLLAALDPSEVHASASVDVPSDPILHDMGFQHGAARVTDAATVARMKALLG
ncbi:MAG: copper homeostasis protein CutC [Rhodobacteraceae bacterium]|nr:copper homeostasis protein CutC [Paracoccaceae bacterium]